MEDSLVKLGALSLPSWMYAGAAICGIPVEASRGLYGWYAQNGVSLNNPRLGFICVSEDMTGQFGLCGYFKEFDRALSPQERLQFAERSGTQFNPAQQPTAGGSVEPRAVSKQRHRNTRSNTSATVSAP